MLLTNSEGCFFHLQRWVACPRRQNKVSVTVAGLDEESHRPSIIALATSATACSRDVGHCPFSILIRVLRQTRVASPVPTGVSFMPGVWRVQIPLSK